jgi:glycerol-3-phosphate O-acyltransferase
MKRERDAALAANTKMALSAVNMAASLDEMKAELVNLRSNKDQLLTQDDGDYLRQRLGEMVKLEAERDALLAALQDLADTNNDFSEALVRARRAIARATTEKP